MVLVMFVVLRAEDEVVCENIGGKGDNGNSEAREEVSEHHALLKYGVMAPCIPLGPRISE
jgi:hypothetical protein